MLFRPEELLWSLKTLLMTIDRKQNVFGMMISLNMLIETGTGFDYTFSDFNKWAKMTGFNSTNLLPLVGPTSAAIAYK